MSQATDTDTVREDGTIRSVSGPVVQAVDLDAKMNDVVYVGTEGLMGEVIEIEGNVTTIQVYEETSGVGPGEPVENTGDRSRSTSGRVRWTPSTTGSSARSTSSRNR